MSDPARAELEVTTLCDAVRDEIAKFACLAMRRLWPAKREDEVQLTAMIFAFFAAAQLARQSPKAARVFEALRMLDDPALAQLLQETGLQ